MTTSEQARAAGILPEDPGSIKGMRFARWFVWFVWAYFSFVIIVLTLAFILLLFNANPDVGFVSWVYRSADRAMEPFRGIFPTETAGNGSVIDFSILFAMIVYGIVASLVQTLVNFLDRRIAEERAKVMYVAQEEQRRREYAASTDAQQAAARYQVQQDVSAAQIASRQVAAQEQTAEAAAQLAGEPPEPPPMTPQG